MATNSNTYDDNTQAKPAFQLKGGLYHFMTMKPATTELNVLETQLISQVEQAPNFFRQASVIIDLQQINKDGLSDSLNLKSIHDLLRKHSLFPIGVSNATPEQRAHAAAVGLAPLSNNGNGINQSSSIISTTKVGRNNQSTSTTSLHNIPMKSAITPSTANSGNNSTSNSTSGSASNSTSSSANSSLSSINNNSNANESGTRLITTPVRSGQQLYSPNGDLIITSSVSNGAELIADGNIHVYGSLRGRALAGIDGNQNARIFCSSLEAELVSIAGQFKMSDDFAKEYWKHAVEIFIKNGQLHIRDIDTPNN